MIVSISPVLYSLYLIITCGVLLQILNSSPVCGDHSQEARGTTGNNDYLLYFFGNIKFSRCWSTLHSLYSLTEFLLSNHLDCIQRENSVFAFCIVERFNQFSILTSLPPLPSPLGDQISAIRGVRRSVTQKSQFIVLNRNTTGQVCWQHQSRDWGW